MCEKEKTTTPDNGKLWFLIDNSFNLHEAETVHPQTAKPDIENITQFFNDIRDKKNTAELNRIIKASSEAGHNEGSFAEAQESLKKRFTDRELDVIITMYWQSPMMQEIRDRLYALEQAVILPDIKTKHKG